jgi:hypothetical protein
MELVSQSVSQLAVFYTNVKFGLFSPKEERALK